MALRQSVETKKIKIFRMSKWYPCKEMGKSALGKKNKVVSNQKELLQVLNEMIK